MFLFTWNEIPRVNLMMEYSEKFELIKTILKTEDDEILLSLGDSVDFWDELSEKDQVAINDCLRQLNEGVSVSHYDVKRIIFEKFRF